MRERLDNAARIERLVMERDAARADADRLRKALGAVEPNVPKGRAGPSCSLSPNEWAAINAAKAAHDAEVANR